MKENRVLYQIKSLEKMVVRSFLSDMDKELTLIPTPTQMQIIEYILEHDDEDIYQKDLEQILNLRRATVSGVLQTMEKNGLLERVTYLLDARTKKIILNEKAKTIFLQNVKKMQEIENIMIEDINQDDLVIFSKVVSKMKENLKKNNK